MDKELKFEDALLIKAKDSNKLQVANIDKNGKINMKELKPEENPDFLRIDKNGNVLENFFENFMRQVKNPTHFDFFRIPLVKILELQDAVKNSNDPANVKIIDLYKIEPKELPQYTQSSQHSQTNHAINPDLVNWDKFLNYGVTRDMLDKSGDMDKLLDYRKTGLLPVDVKFEDETKRTDGRFSLRKQDDGSFLPHVHLIRHEPEIDRPYFGVKFTLEDRTSLLTTGNLGRIIEAEFKPGEKTPVLLSLDKLTNELVAFRKDWLKVPDTYKGVQLSDEQKQKLGEGKAVSVEDMISKNGKPFNADVQFNADKRFFELLFDNTKKQEQSQKQNTGETVVPKTFRKIELTEDQRSSLSEGKTVHVDGLKDKSGKPYNGYITINNETGKTDFMFPKQYKDALAEGKVIPDDRHKTQVDINSKGKTNEATKDLKEPLNEGQTKPTEKQAEEQKKKSRGIKM